ncbi:TBC1 domain member 7 [Entophlyctis luteolus]|nr:TBC1 domain member 7 [Entophlyctis luteolus]KAJ3386384.1 TBC1 domain member 7 [Entophlyctis sp. JEL0112]
MNKDFRKAYYGSLGVKTVAPKASLDVALRGSDGVVEVPQLVAICRAVKIPRIYRPLVWKLVLGVIPPVQQAWSFVDSQHAEIHDDLKAAQRVLLAKMSQRNLLSDTDVMMHMMLIHSSSGFRLSNQKIPPHMQSIAECISEVCDGNEIDAYWIFKYFLKTLEVSANQDAVIVREIFDNISSNKRTNHRNDIANNAESCFN